MFWSTNHSDASVFSYVVIKKQSLTNRKTIHGRCQKKIGEGCQRKHRQPGLSNHPVSVISCCIHIKDLVWSVKCILPSISFWKKKKKTQKNELDTLNATHLRPVQKYFCYGGRDDISKWTLNICEYNVIIQIGWLSQIDKEEFHKTGSKFYE